MKAIEIRNKYLEFFKRHGHAVIPSAPLIPENDPSVLFTTAGMQPLVPYLLGEKHPEGTRLTDYQKCVRTNDIDEVGDNRHLTYFEMLGNWSLGDYFKEESIAMSFEFLTKELGIPVEKLSVTCFAGDEDCPRDEIAANAWKKAGILENHIYFQEIKRTNDLLFTNKALILASRIVILDEALVHYRIQIKDSCQSTNYLYSEDFFLAFQALMQFLKEYGIWDQVAMSYRNHALDGCIANLDSLEFRDEHERLYKHLKESIFRILEIDLLAEEDVLKENLDKKERYNLIMSESYLTYVKNRADVYRLLFRNLQFSSYLQNVKQKEDNYKLEEELNHIKQSKTFTLGKVLIHVPQKIYWFVKQYCK